MHCLAAHVIIGQINNNRTFIDVGIIHQLLDIRKRADRNIYSFKDLQKLSLTMSLLESTDNGIKYSIIRTRSVLVLKRGSSMSLGLPTA